MNEQQNTDQADSDTESVPQTESSSAPGFGERARNVLNKVSREAGPVATATTAHLALVGRYIGRLGSQVRQQFRVRSEQARLGAALYAAGAGTDQSRGRIREIDDELDQRKDKPAFLNWNLRRTRTTRCRELAEAAADYETESPDVLETRQSFEAARTAAESSKKAVDATMSQLSTPEGLERKRLFWGYGTLVVVGLFLFALLGPSDTSVADLLDAEEHFANSVLSYAEEDFEQAIEHADACLDESPTHHGAFHLRGWCYHTLEDFDAAEWNFEEALEAHPDCPHCWTRLALARLTDSDTWEEVSRRNNDYWAVTVDTKRELGGSQIDNQRLAEQSLETEPDSAVAHWLQGNARKASRDWDRAIEAYDRAIELAPDFVLPYLARAICHQEIGRIEEEVQDLRRAVELAPESGTTHLQLFYHLQQQSAPHAEQLSALDRAVETAPRDGEGLFYAYFNRAMVHHAMSVDGAPEHYERALQDLSIATKVQHVPGWKLYVGDGPRTLQRFEPIAQNNPDDALAWYMYGSGASANLDVDQLQATLSLLSRGMQESVEMFGGETPAIDPTPENVRNRPELAVQRAARLDDSFTPPMLLAGVWLLAGGELEDGLSWFERVAATDHCPPVVLSRLVELNLYPREDIEAAREYADLALARFPDDPDCLLAMAKVRMADEQYQDATRNILSALEIAPWGRSAGPFDVSEAYALLSIIRRLESDEKSANQFLSAAVTIGNSPLANLEEGKRLLNEGDERTAGERLLSAWHSADQYDQVKQAAADAGHGLFCTSCSGSGQVLVTGQIIGSGGSGTTEEWQVCPRCRGDGLEPSLRSATDSQN